MNADLEPLFRPTNGQGVVVISGIFRIDGEAQGVPEILAIFEVLRANASAGDLLGLAQHGRRKLDRELLTENDGQHVDAGITGAPEYRRDGAHRADLVLSPLVDSDDHDVALGGTSAVGRGHEDVRRKRGLLGNDDSISPALVIHSDDLSPRTFQYAHQASLGVSARKTPRDAYRDSIPLHGGSEVSLRNVDVLSARDVRDDEAVTGPSDVDDPRHDLEASGNGVPALPLPDDLPVALHGLETPPEAAVGVAANAETASQVPGRQGAVARLGQGLSDRGTAGNVVHTVRLCPLGSESESEGELKRRVRVESGEIIERASDVHQDAMVPQTDTQSRATPARRRPRVAAPEVENATQRGFGSQVAFKVVEFRHGLLKVSLHHDAETLLPGQESPGDVKGSSHPEPGRHGVTRGSRR